MNKCQFYKEYIQQLPSREISSQLKELKLNVCPYCINDNALGTEITKNIVTSVMGGSLNLQCNGDIDKCQLPSYISNKQVSHSKEL